MKIKPVFFANHPASSAPAWERLLECSHPPKFQHEFGYMIAWKELSQRDWNPLVLFGKEGGALREIVPLVYRNEIHGQTASMRSCSRSMRSLRSRPLSAPSTMALILNPDSPDRS